MNRAGLSRSISLITSRSLWHLALFAVVLFAFTPIAYSQQSKTAQKSDTREWLQFRGPNGTGVAEGFTLPAEFAANKNLVWKTPLPFARSSPVVTTDRVFITATEGDKLSAFALDRKTGKIVLATRRDLLLWKCSEVTVR